jgi:hypothetical protein
VFEEALAQKFKTIFDVSKVRYDLPGESQEQETLFVEVELSRNRIRDGEFIARVQGKASIFAPADKLPFGYFTRCIEAHPDETKDLFFSDIEGNSRVFGNIVQRGFSFVYFFHSQYDPELGTLNSIEFEVET